MIPKNIRQIGEGESSRKVYIEDYVITFLKQIQKKLSGASQSVSLYGNIFEEDGNTYVIVKGATALAEKEDKYFKDCMIVGQAVIMKELGVGLGKIVETAGNMSAENRTQSIYYEIRENDTIDETRHRNDIFDSSNMFFLEKGKLEPLRTYYLFYEKNDAMQEYLIDWNSRGRNGKSENSGDHAVSAFRRNYYEKQDYFQQKKMMAYFYVLCSCMMIISCVIGISMLNSYEKMKNLEAAMSHLTVVMNEQKLPDIAVEIPMEMPQTTEQNQNNEAETEEIDNIIAGTMIEKTASMGEASMTEEVPVNEIQTEPSAAETLNGQVYIVQEGDTLADISRKFYDTNQRVDEICSINSITDPNKIVMGQNIILP